MRLWLGRAKPSRLQHSLACRQTSAMPPWGSGVPSVQSGSARRTASSRSSARRPAAGCRILPRPRAPRLRGFHARPAGLAATSPASAAIAAQAWSRTARSASVAPADSNAWRRRPMFRAISLPSRPLGTVIVALSPRPRVQRRWTARWLSSGRGSPSLPRSSASSSALRSLATRQAGTEEPNGSARLLMPVTRGRGRPSRSGAGSGWCRSGGSAASEPG
jgi:hypothetical protein